MQIPFSLERENDKHKQYTYYLLSSNAASYINSTNEIGNILFYGVVISDLIENSTNSFP